MEQKNISYMQLVMLQKDFEEQLRDRNISLDGENYDDALFDFVQQYIDGINEPEVIIV